MFITEAKTPLPRPLNIYPWKFHKTPFPRPLNIYTWKFHKIYTPGVPAPFHNNQYVIWPTVIQMSEIDRQTLVPFEQKRNENM